MTVIERYEAKGDPLKGSVILHGRGVPSIFAQTYNLKDAETIAAALNDLRGAVEDAKRLRGLAEWLVSLDGDEAERRTVDLQYIIESARDALGGR